MSGRRAAARVALAVAAAMMLMWGPVALADESAEITGEVRDATGGVIPGATVIVRPIGTREGESELTAITDTAGAYRVASLLPGDYMITAVAPGFLAGSHRVNVPAGVDLAVNFLVQIAPGTEEITVRTAVQAASGGQGGIVSGEALRNLPTKSRSYHDLMLFEPGVGITTNRQSRSLYTHGVKITVGGAGPRANLFLLDGGSVSDFYRNTLGSITGVFLGLEAVQEAKVVTNSYGAAEPGVGGGVLSIVTKTGGNTFHGSVFEFFRDGRLNARSFFDEQKPNLRRHQFGMAAGGRLVRDRTFFFATAERLDERMGIGRVTTVPSLAAREGRLPDPVRPGWTIPVHPAVQPFLALFPLPNGQDFGDGLAEHSFESEQRANETLGQIRVDHALTASQRLFVRYTRTTGTKHEPWHFPGFGIDWQGRNHFLTVEDRLALGSTLAGTLRFAYGGTNVMQTDEVGGRVFEHLAIIPGRPMPQLAIGGMPNVGALPSSLNRAVQHHFSWSGDMSLLRSGHLLKWGGAVERFNVLSHFGFFWAGRFNFAGIEQFLRGQPSTLLAALPGADPVRELSTLQFSAYVQDEIVVTPALSLNLGLRWDVATAPIDSEGRLVNLRDPTTDSELTTRALLRTRKRNLAPRAGFSWVPDRERKVVIRGGAGVYFDVNTLPYITQTVTNPPFFNQVTLFRPSLTEPALTSARVLSLGIPSYDWQTPTMLHYSLGADGEIGSGTSIGLAYVGSQGYHLVRAGEINPPVPEILPDGTRFFPAGAPRRNPHFGSIILRRPDGRSRYDALHVRVRRYTVAGLWVQGAYTLSRAIDEGQGTLPTEALGTTTYWLYSDDRRLDRGLADFHRRHSLALRGSWDWAFFASARGVAGALGQGWRLSAVLVAQSGHPFTVAVRDDYSRALARVPVTRPSLRPGAGPIVLGGPERYFDPTAFELPPAGTFGNVGRNTLIGPGLVTLDVALTKDFRASALAGDGRVQLRLEAFNLLNRANFGFPQRIVFAGVRQDEPPLQNAGRITSTVTGPREIQLGVKFIW